ncbi:MAG: hypothetical protein GY859_22500 [Desulfobacterales bacterium]|nr:hypothetical protein [Desulfobacterales bacterium]
MAPKLGMKKRVSWVIVDIIKKNELSNIKLGRILECGKNTINNYRNEGNLPGAEFIARLSDYYGVNVEWLHTNVGDPYHGDGLGPREPLEEEKRPPVRYSLGGNGGSSSHAVESVAEPSPSEDARLQALDLRISSVLAKASRILESESPYGKALFQNIDYLYQSIMVEKKNLEIRLSLGKLRKQVRSLKSRVKDLKGGRKSATTGKKRVAKKTQKTGTAKDPKREKIKKAPPAAKTATRKAKKAQPAVKTAARKAKKAQPVAKTAARKTKKAQPVAKTATRKAKKAQPAAKTATGKAKKARPAAKTGTRKVKKTRTAAKAKVGRPKKSATTKGRKAGK